MEDKFVIELVDTDRYRNHTGHAQLTIDNDKIYYEAISTCNHYDTSDSSMPPTEDMPYYIRQKHKRIACNGVQLSSSYYEGINKTLYRLDIPLTGSSDDICINFENRVEAHKLYRKLSDWIFD